jgi:hypothetical protein
MRSSNSVCVLVLVSAIGLSIETQQVILEILSGLLVTQADTKGFIWRGMHGIEPLLDKLQVRQCLRTGVCVVEHHQPTTMRVRHTDTILVDTFVGLG